MRDRHLIVMRHAKAEPFAASDAGRRLTDRGRLDAAEAGRFLRDLELDLDHAWVSPAARTRATWEEVATAWGTDLAATFDEGLYVGGADDVLSLVHGSPAEARAVLMVGHNPTMSYLCHVLDDGRGEEPAASEMLRGFPTAATAVFTVAADWADLAAEGARLRRFHPGRP